MEPRGLPERPVSMKAAALFAFVSVLAAACGSAGSDPDSATAPHDSPPAPTAGEPAVPSTAPPATGVALAVSGGVQRAPVDPDAPVDELAAGWNDAGFDVLRSLPAGDNAGHVTDPT
jgi:hypothetical protein